MKSRWWIVSAAFWIVCSSLSWGGTLPGSISRGSIFSSEGLDRLTIGGGYEDMKREFRVEDRGIPYRENGDLRSYYGYIGYDLQQWCTLFVTLGASEMETEDRNFRGNSEMKWSVGVSANIWKFDVEDPPALAGCLTIKGTAELARYASSDHDADVYFVDMFASMPFGYEILAESRGTDTEVVHSLALYVGPAVSTLDGKVDWARGGGSADISAVTRFGVVAGVDLFLFRNLSLGAQWQYFGDDSISGSLRYRF